MENNFNGSEQSEQNNSKIISNVIPSNRRKSFDIKNRNRWWIPVSIILGIITICFIGFFVTIGSFISIFKDTFRTNYIPVEIKDKTVLKLDFGNVSEISRDNNLFAFFSNEVPNPTFYELIESIKSAANDDRIVGLYYDGTGIIGGALAKELKSALLEFKKSGKFIYSYLESASISQYNIAVLSDSIFIPDEGIYELGGFGVSSLFLKGLYDKIGLQYEVIQCEEFKTAAEPYKNYKFSDSARVAYIPLLRQKENDFIQTVSSSRNIEQNKVIELMQEGILTSDELIEFKLADNMATKRQFLDMLQLKVTLLENNQKEISNKSTDKNAIAKTKNTKIISLNNSFESENIVSICDYINSETVTNKYAEDTDCIAVICGEGPIVTEQIDNLFSYNAENQIVSTDFVELIEKATKDNNVKGIIIRINSPGGSVIASEEIYQAILEAKKIKPIIASMSNTAASGGYYIAMACDKIIAAPETVTGSIGVVAAIPNFTKTLEKLNINLDTISTGTGNPFFISPFMELKTKDKNKFHKMINKTYQKFITKAAKSRNMTFENMKKCAKGRVWTGIDAKNIGLIDSLGNLELAVNILKDKLGNKNLTLSFSPKYKTSLEDFKKLFSKRNINLTTFDIANFDEKTKKQLNYLNILNKISQKEQIYCALPQLIFE